MRRDVTISLAVVVLTMSVVSAGQDYTRFAPKGTYTLDELYSYPIKWGVAPGAVTWSPDSRAVAFLWNAEGRRLLDIYAVAVPDGKVSRLTDLCQLPADALQDDRRTEQQKADAARLDGGVSGFTWSPDGRQIAFTYRGDVFIVPASGGVPRRVVRTAGAETGVQFSPDGTRLGFVRSGNVWALDLPRGGEAQLTTMTPADGVSIARWGWSADGARLFVALTDISHYQKEAMPDFTLDHVVATLHPERYFRNDSPRARLGIAPGDGGVIRWVDLETTDVGLASVQWFPDGSRLLANVNRTGTRDWILTAIDAKTLAKTVLFTETGVSRYANNAVQFSGDGTRILMPSFRDGWLHLYTMPTAGGALTQITRGEWDLQTNINSPRFIDVPRQGNRVYFGSGAVHPVEKHVFSVGVDGGEVVRLSPQNPGTYVPYASPDGRYLVVDYSSVESPNDLYLIDPAVPGVMTRLTTSPLAGFAGVALVKPRYASFKNPKDGVEVFYRMLLPPGFDEKGGRRYPVVFTHMYADEAKNFWSRYKPFEAFLAAEMNYIVVSLDGRGSSGRGRAFTDGRNPSEAVKDVEDHLEAAKFLKTLPFVDPTRIGCWGKSYGGDLALMVLFQEPGVFDTSVSIQPVTRRPRAIFAPDRLKANLLLIHSSIDTTVYFRETALMLQALVDARKYADFWLYPKEDHSLALRDESFGDAMKRVARYFEDHFSLGPESARPRRRTELPAAKAPGGWR